MRLLFLGSLRLPRRFEFGQRLLITIVFGIRGLVPGEIVRVRFAERRSVFDAFAARSSDDAMIARSSN